MAKTNHALGQKTKANALPKDWKKIVKFAKKQGWKLAERGRHLHLVPPEHLLQQGGPPYVVIPTTPSGPRNLANTKAVLRRSGLDLPR